MKMIAGILSVVLIIVGSTTVFYWRDTGFEPAVMDLVKFLILVPVGITCILLTPYMVRSFLQFQNEKKKKTEETATVDKEQNIPETVSKPDQYDFNIYSTSAWHAFGENTEIHEGLKRMVSPELHSQLINEKGLPILSYAIKSPELDHDSDDAEMELQHRLVAFIEHQLSHNDDVLSTVVEQLKKSARHYHIQPSYQYKLHAGWYSEDVTAEDPDDFQDEIPDDGIPRLDRLSIHIILNETVTTWCSEDIFREKIEQFFEHYELESSRLELEFHYLNALDSQQKWFDLLKDIHRQQYTVSFLLCLDSDMDQRILDEKTWNDTDYIPSEFITASLLAPSTQEVEALKISAKLRVKEFAESLKNTVADDELLSMDDTELQDVQFFILYDMTSAAKARQFNRFIADSALEPEQFIYTRQGLGSTQELSIIFGFMVGMLPGNQTSVLYSTEFEKNAVIIKSITN
ncbi:hypothetical protein CDG60_12585 [Acinetobacter chinensis]|uniref:DUF2875 domain-containing protein n=1 Tax=Acinetobacter chinensis TaxID=2004650 RepID=A0A3B7M484_9GAMM|nr:hypothetical protein [Acinetobacter chinensis]AXY57329.1 hypothetical protein CDG60_12585 [Acinetobacter chinensis]